MKLANTRIGAQEKLNLMANMVTMLKAGIPIASVVETLLEDAKGGEKAVLTTIQQDLNSGKTLADAFEEFPRVFDRVTINLVRAAEQAGTLEQTLTDLVKTIKKDMEFVDKVKGAMFYPLMVMVVFVAVFLMILIVVMPKISQVFGRMKMPLPITTRLMIASSDFLVNKWPWLVAALVVGIVLLFLLYRSRREQMIKGILSLPGISALSRQIDVTRFSRSMNLLLVSGVPITEALQLAAGVVWTPPVKKAVKNGLEQAGSGLPFSAGLRGKHTPFPAMMIKLIEVGEQTGTLDASMQNVAEYMDDQVSKTLSKLTMMLEPIMLVLVGVAVGAMMMSIIGPIYSMIGQVSGR